MTESIFPSLTLNEWRETRDALNTYAKIVGKIRRALAPPQKHWWHVSLQPTTVGFTTAPIVANGQVFEIVIDLTDHQTYIVTSYGQRWAFMMNGQSAANYCQQLELGLVESGLAVDFDKGVCADKEAGAYNETAVAEFWQAFTQVTAVFTAFKHSLRGETSPLQLWPHHFDLALLALTGRLVAGQDPADADNADEQMNFGFVTGDDGIAEAYFYATAYPTPARFADQPLPDAAYWHTEGWTGAILPYAALTTAVDPHEMLLDFLKTAHKAGKTLMK